MRGKLLITGSSGFIGTNLLEDSVKNYSTVLGIDMLKPRNIEHVQYWKQIDIRDYDALEKTVLDFDPDFVIHLAARTDLDGKTLQDYNSNTDGLSNIIKVLKKCKHLKRAILTSSQLVCKSRQPVDDNDFDTVNFYGESKAIGERIIKKDDGIQFEYVIIRPTSIWGPWFGTPYRNFFEIVRKGLYVHFGYKSGKKTIGYVGNSVYQINSLLEAPYDKVEGEVFYIGDKPECVISDWANEVASAYGKRIRRIPFFMVRCLALIGDVLKLANIHFPMSSYRLENMTSTYSVRNLNRIYKIAPNPPYTREEGVRITKEWLDKQ